jgi:hypothetical protein
MGWTYVPKPPEKQFIFALWHPMDWFIFGLMSYAVLDWLLEIFKCKLLFLKAWSAIAFVLPTGSLRLLGALVAAVVVLIAEGVR